MSDPTTPARPDPKAGETADAKTDDTKVDGIDADGTKTDGIKAETAKAASADTTEIPAVPADRREKKPEAAANRKKWWRRVRVRGPWLTVAGVVVVLVVLALLGYEWGLGPLNRLNTNRGITPPAKLSGLDRITDSDIRGQLQLDETQDALRRINDGKKATVEAYGTIDGNRLFVIIALRGKVDIDKTVADSGATPDKVKKVGSSTCVESTGTLPTQCYRGSNTLTVIAQSANEGVTVDQVAPVADEAFTTMK